MKITIWTCIFQPRRTTRAFAGLVRKMNARFDELLATRNDLMKECEALHGSVRAAKGRLVLQERLLLDKEADRSRANKRLLVATMALETIAEYPNSDKVVRGRNGALLGNTRDVRHMAATATQALFDVESVEGKLHTL